jgi:predicted component of type VI protein secretion system
MKCTFLSTAVAVSVFFAACSSTPGKKVIVMSSGKIQVDPSTHTVTLTPGTQHNEAELTLSPSDKGVTVKSPEGEKIYEAPESGLFLLNLKVDTLIGNIVNFGAAGQPTTLTTDQFDHIIDSTQQLLAGANADNKKTFFIVPGSIKKITANINGQLINPYNNIPYKVDLDKDGNVPEIYKFFTAKQKRESLNELIERMKK